MANGFFVLFISLLLSTVIIAATPFLTRRTENFGVTIPEAMYDRDDFLKMRRKYAGILCVSGAILCVITILCAFFLSANTIYMILTAAIFIIVIGGFLLYLPFHFKMKKIKEKENWHTRKHQSVVVDMNFRNEKLVHSSWWFLLPGLILVATISFTFIYYDKIPEQIPMHTDFAGNVRYDEKSIANILILPGTQAFLLVLFLGINIMIKHAKQQISAVNPEKSKQQNVLFRRKWSAFMIVGALIMQLMFAYMQLGFIFPALAVYEDIVLICFISVFLLGTIILAVRTGQGGSRIHIESDQADRNIDRDNDRYWKLGQFYVNRNDPAIFVEKRFGIGWTNNWAHPLSWIVLIGIILLPLIIVWILS